MYRILQEQVDDYTKDKNQSEISDCGLLVKDQVHLNISKVKMLIYLTQQSLEMTKNIKNTKTASKQQICEQKHAVVRSLEEKAQSGISWGS